MNQSTPTTCNRRRSVRNGRGCRRRKIRRAGGGSGSGRSNNVNLPTAYLIYCLGGLFGLHHAYLHRPRQALGWYASAGLFGWGLLHDLFRMPSYVSLANGRPNDVHVKVRAAKVGARDGVPPMSPARIALMWAFGAWFGFLASCMVCLPQEEDPPGSGARGGLWWTSLGWTDVAYGVLGSYGTAGGVWLVGNMGEEAILASPGGGGLGEFTRLHAWCLASYALTNHPVLGGIVCAVRHRRYRPSMRPTATKGTGPPPSTAQRAGRHLLVCAAYTALLAVAAYNHGYVTVDGGRRIYLHEVVRNALNYSPLGLGLVLALNSEFMKEFDWAEFDWAELPLNNN